MGTKTTEKETVEIPFYKWCYGKFIKVGTLIEKK